MSHLIYAIFIISMFSSVSLTRDSVIIHHIFITLAFESSLRYSAFSASIFGSDFDTPRRQRAAISFSASFAISSSRFAAATSRRQPFRLCPSPVQSLRDYFVI